MPKRKIILILVSVILAVLLIWFGYLWGAKKGIFQKETKEAETTVSREMEAGLVGEVMVQEEESGQEAPLVSPTMPPAVFSTAGTVTKIESDRIIIRGDGTNFADGIPRTITTIFTTDTSTFVSGQAFRWQGLAGLKQLQPGTKILVDSQENIRGKTEFQVKTINIL